jgi:hypothetical protein
VPLCPTPIPRWICLESYPGLRGEMGTTKRFCHLLSVLFNTFKTSYQLLLRKPNSTTILTLFRNANKPTTPSLSCASTRHTSSVGQGQAQGAGNREHRPWPWRSVKSGRVVELIRCFRTSFDEIRNIVYWVTTRRNLAGGDKCFRWNSDLHLQGETYKCGERRVTGRTTLSTRHNLSS